MDYVDQNIYSIDEDITLNECIDIIISLYKGPNKDKVREHLHEIFIYSKITDYIILKDALWISNSLNVPLFITLYNCSSRYLNGYLIEQVGELRKVFGRMTKNKKKHMNYINFRSLFVHSVLFKINELLNSSV